MRLWVIKNYIPEYNGKLLTDQQLVDTFIANNSHWYNDPANGLFGWQDKVRESLLEYLTHNNIEMVHSQMPQTIYVINKFEKEWIGPDGQWKSLKKKYRDIFEPFQISEETNHENHKKTFKP